VFFFPEEHLVRLSGAGEESFRDAALVCLDGLYGFALALSRDATTAEDLVQETYARALAARRKAGPDDNVRVWLFVILHNVWRNQLRRRQLAADDPAALLELQDPAAGPEQALEQKRLRRRLREAIAALPESFRQVVVLRCVEEFSYQEVAAIVGCPTGTVMSRLARGRAMLRRLLRPARVDLRGKARAS
jgi:RNA polymerase sigma-70 factor (ECF subfamily)